jgi:beta-glucosidase
MLALDVIHGHRTIFPVPLAEAGSFAPEMWEKTARAAAEETAQDGVAMVDSSRDPLGMHRESPGEDPRLGSEFAAAERRDFQGRRPRGPRRH